MLHNNEYHILTYHPKMEQLKSSILPISHGGSTSLNTSQISLSSHSISSSQSCSPSKPNLTIEIEDIESQVTFLHKYSPSSIEEEVSPPPLIAPYTPQKKVSFKEVQFTKQKTKELPPLIEEEPVTLIKRLTFLEQHKQRRNQVEKAILLFNSKPELALQYLVKEKLCKDSPQDFANFLLITEGLDKVKIGQLLGSPKQEFQAILKEFANLIEFEGMEFDKALRMFLDTFRLPGEAQQIDRIISAFAESYYKDNPNSFPDLDTCYVMAYSLIMLNTDAHSDKVPAHKKMTKPQFVRNNREVLSTMSESYLEEIYDRIVHQKFETKIDCLEQAYKRIIFFCDTIKQGRFGTDSSYGLMLKNAVKMMNSISEGSVFIKYPKRSRKPTRRFVFVCKEKDKVCWRSARKTNQKVRGIKLSEVYDIVIGSNSTPTFQKFNIPPEYDSTCFSLITKKRTLDLRAESIETHELWVAYFREIANSNYNKQIRIEPSIGAEEDSKKKLDEIWQNEIFPYWDLHWDYASRQPRRYEAPIRKGCFSLNNKENTDTSISNKGYLLSNLWKQGLPPWVRRTLWPLAIGNYLNINQSLYDSLKNTPDSIAQSGNKQDYLTALCADIPNSYNESPNILSKHDDQLIYRILKSVVIYRPDIGYVPGMVHILGVLLWYVDEYDSFQCFLNIINSHHFLYFFSNDMAQIKWRIDFFDKLFANTLPNLKKHFEALELKSELYLIEWLVYLYSKNLEIEVVSRIWDNFLLEGEIFAYKSAIAILKYFERDLIKQSFSGALSLLQKPSIDESLFFQTVFTIQTSRESFEALKLEHNKAIQKSNVMQTVMQYT